MLITVAHRKIERMMTTFRRKILKHIVIWILFLILIAACSDHSTPVPATPSLPGPPTEALNGLSDENFATIKSLEKVDDYPLYIMHYHGGYNYPKIELSWPQESDFACSLFAALSKQGDMFYGRNFDWDFSPALLLFTDPPDGYASVSMVDLTFLGISPDAATSLNDLPLAERTALLTAPSMPFDGMNEYGLTIAMAAVPYSGQSDAGDAPSKPTIGSIGIIREVLDHARDVDEAVALFKQYNIDFSGGPPIHYLIADTSGKAVLLEIYQGELVILTNEDPWHLATNHLRCVARGDGGCQRYRTLSERLSATNGHMDERTALLLLSDVAQTGTQWSIAYNMTSGDVSVVIGQAYETVFRFYLDRVSP